MDTRQIGMTLRSACDGTCSSPLTAASSVSNTGRVSSGNISATHHHHHNHHHHHHDHHHSHPLQEGSKGKDISTLSRVTLLERNLVEKGTNVVSRLQGLGRHSKSSSVSHYSGQLVSTETTKVKVSVGESVFKLRIRDSSSLGSLRRNQHIDYSSADDLDLDEKPKTDYTYAHSYGYNSRTTPDERCPTPNMSRHRLRNSGGSDSSPALLHHNSSDSFQSVSGGTTTCSAGGINVAGASDETSRFHHVHNSERNSNSLPRNGISYTTSASSLQGGRGGSAWYMRSMYGLDSDSEGEMVAESRSRYINTATHHSWFSTVIKYVLKKTGFMLRPWFIFWSSVYWVISSILLLDTKLLVRIRQLMSSGSRLCKLLPLLLFFIPFLLAGYHMWNYSTNQGSLSVLTAVANSTVSSLSYYFSLLRTETYKTAVNVEVPPVENSWLNLENFGGVVRQMIIQIYGSPEEGKGTVKNDLKLQQMIRDIVQEELLSFHIQTTSDRQSVENSKKKLGHVDKQDMENLEFKKLKGQIQAIAQEATALKEEVTSVKEELNSWHQSLNIAEDNGLRLSKLQVLILGMEEKVAHLEKNHGLFLAAMRNCCLNHSDYAAFVEEHVAVVLNQMPDIHNLETCGRFSNFRNWLKSYFATKEELNQNFDDINVKMAPVITEELESKIRKAVDLAVSDIVEKYLKGHSAKMEKANLGGESQGMLTETAIRTLIQQQLKLYNADKTGLADYALESSGGSVISTRCSETYQLRTAQWIIFGIPLWYVTSSPRTVIQPGVSPGECWAIKGSRGYIVIQLSELVKISAFSLEHIPKSIAPSGNIDSAPKEFSVWGLQNEEDAGVCLGNYIYEEDGDPLQHFLVQDVENTTFKMVELRIHSNHGNTLYTCLYRFRVHGEIN